MSQYGTTEEYAKGYDDGVNDTAERYRPLLLAAAELLQRWGTNKNLTVQIQALHHAVQALPDPK
jgi:hypothetical protein